MGGSLTCRLERTRNGLDFSEPRPLTRRQNRQKTLHLQRPRHRRRELPALLGIPGHRKRDQKPPGIRTHPRSRKKSNDKRQTTNDEKEKETQLQRTARTGETPRRDRNLGKPHRRTGRMPGQSRLLPRKRDPKPHRRAQRIGSRVQHQSRPISGTAGASRRAGRRLSRRGLEVGQRLN